jgi:hypothetical protein
MSVRLVFPDQPPPSVQEAVTTLLPSHQAGIIPTTPDVFIRIVRLDAVLESGQILTAAQLAISTHPPTPAPPVAFLTIPEGIVGFAADAILSRLGYTASEIVDVFHGSQAAAIVFKFPNAVKFLTSLDDGASSSVLQRVVPSTWDNLFRTFTDLATHEENPLHLSDDDRQFVASFPLSGQSRLKSESYSQIQTEQGNDWRYRQLLQILLWATPEFLGTGWAADENGGPGVPEYLGPNVFLSDLSNTENLAIVSL